MKEIRQFFIGHGATVVFPLGDIPLGVHADSLQSISSRRDRLMLVRWGVVGLTCLIKPAKANRGPLRHLNQLKHLMAIRSKPKLLVV
jgi:hypothetical protein